METTTITTKRVLAIVLMAVATLALATLSACGGKSAETTIRESVTSELESIKKLDQDALDQIVGGANSVSDLSEYGISTEEFFRTWLEGFDYSVDKVTVNGDKATATVTIKVKSLTSAMDSISNNISSIIASNPAMLTMTQEQIYKEIGNLLMKAVGEAPITSTTVDLPYELKNNTWQPASGFDAAIAKAFTGTSA